MAKITDPQALTAAPPTGRTDSGVPPDESVTCDQDKFRDYVDLLGRAQALYWLDVFHDGLAMEFSPPLGQAPDDGRSHANIHQLCARAGLIGFQALHRACLDYLEARAENGDTWAAYRRVRDQAEQAFGEIERQRAILA